MSVRIAETQKERKLQRKEGAKKLILEYAPGEENPEKIVRLVLEGLAKRHLDRDYYGGTIEEWERNYHEFAYPGCYL